jgi:hypothetical protein
MKKKNNKTQPPQSFTSRPLTGLKRKTSENPGALPNTYMLNAASLKYLAMAGKSIAEAELTPQFSLTRSKKIKSKQLKGAGRQKSLNEIFAEKPHLKKAWERGTFLKNIADFGGKNYTIAEAESELGLSAGELDKIFLSDFEASNTWNQARLKTLLAIKGKWLEMVGMASPSALKQLEKLMRKEIAHQAADFMHLTSKQMQELTGKTRQTVEYEWPRNYGLSRNSDGSYNLAVFLKWFEKFTLETKQTTKITEPEVLRNKKAEMLDLELKEKIGQLLDRNQVIAGLLARHQFLKNSFDKRTDKLPGLLENQPLERIRKILSASFAEICNELANSAIELKLNEGQNKKFRELIENL